MATQYILNLVQKAFAAHLRNQTFDFISPEQIYTGIDRDADNLEQSEEKTRVLPCVECVCQSAETDGMNFSGSWTAHAEIRVRTNMDDTDEDTHHEIVGDVMDTIITDSIAADISSAQSGFFAQLVVPMSQRWSIEGRACVTILALDVHSAPSDLS